jgi:predicted transport protein
MFTLLNTLSNLVYIAFISNKEHRKIHIQNQNDIIAIELSMEYDSTCKQIVNDCIYLRH